MDTSVLVTSPLISGAMTTLSLLFFSACFTISLPTLELTVLDAVSPLVVAEGLAVVSVADTPPSVVLSVVTGGVDGVLPFPPPLGLAHRTTVPVAG